MPHVTKGKLIVIDGVDGSGKSTQARLLVEALEFGGFAAELVKFPQYGSRAGVLAESYLAGEFGELNPHAAGILFALDRFDASSGLRQLLAEGKIVVCDRYALANSAHQGGKIESQPERIAFFKWLDGLEFNIFGIPKPDLNIILDLDAKLAFKRLKKSGKKLDKHETNIKHLENVRAVYLEIAKLFPNTKLVSCAIDAKELKEIEVHNQVWSLVRRIVLRT